MARSTTRITKSVVDSMKPDQLIWDVETKGFGVRRQKTTVRSYLYRYPLGGGKTKTHTIGIHGSPWTADNARTEAKRLQGEIAAGKLPTKTKPGVDANPTVADFMQRYLTDHAYLQKKPRSAREDEGNIRNHIVPLIGTLPVADLRRADIEKLKTDIRNGKTAVKRTKDSVKANRGGKLVQGGATAANRCVMLMSKAMNLAEAWGIRPENSNPARGVQKYKELPRERYLSDEEVARFNEALKNDPERSGANAIRMLLLTGARRDEILSLKWEFIDWQNSVAFLPDSKTGKKRLFLSSLAMDLLRSIDKTSGNSYVFAGKKEGKPFVGVTKVMARILEKANIPHTRLHDLRHTFASIAINDGTPLSEIGALLAHKSTQTTKRYAHLADTNVQNASRRVGERMKTLMHFKSKDSE